MSTRNCYCQDHELGEAKKPIDSNDGILENDDRCMICSKCKSGIHLKCLAVDPESTLKKDFLFDLTCKRCTNTGHEEYKRPKLPWPHITALLLYNLSLERPGTSGFFHYQYDITDLLFVNAACLMAKTRVRKDQYSANISSCLNSYQGITFLSGTDILGKTGWWKLANNITPLLTDVFTQSEVKPVVDTSLGSRSRRKRKELSGDFITDFTPKSKKVAKSIQRQNEKSSSKNVLYALGLTHSRSGQEQAADSSSSIQQGDESAEPAFSDPPINSLVDRFDVDMESDKLFTDMTTESLVSTPDDLTLPTDAIDMDTNLLLSQSETNTKPGDLTESYRGGNLKDEPADSNEVREDAVSDQTDTAEASRVTSPCPVSENSVEPDESTKQPKDIKKEVEEKPKLKFRRWTAYEEEILKNKLDDLTNQQILTPRQAMVRQLLALRKRKRSLGLPLFDINKYSESYHPNITSEVNINDGQLEVGLVSSDTYKQTVLDRFQTSFSYSTQTVFVPFINKLHSVGHQYRNTKSQYTSRILKAFIWRDHQTKPPKLKILEAIRKRSEDDITEGQEQESIDYKYVSTEHIPIINRMCHVAFWPGIDLSECLQYSDFTCVAMYKKLVIGFAFMVPDVSHNEAYVSFIYTHPDWRGAGIASVMLYHLTQTCMGKDITLHVSMNNPAINLYLKFGFKVVEIIHNFYEKFHPADSLLSPHAFVMRLERY